MALDDIPNEIHQFIARYLKSVGQLELILFLFDGREKAWSVDDLIREMRTNQSLVEQQLRDLEGPTVQISGEPVRYQFNIGDSYLLELVRKLAEQYRSRRHAIISEIYSQPLATIQSFADAFKIKKD